MTRDQAQDMAVSNVLGTRDPKGRIRASVVAGTGFGKTRVLCRAAHSEGMGKILVSVPFDHLKDRFREEHSNLGLPIDDVDMICHVSLLNTDLSIYGTIIIDEAHLALTDRCMEALIPFNGNIVMGTATLPDDRELRDRLLYLCPMAFELSLDECVRRGYVAPYSMVCLGIGLTPAEAKAYKTVSANFGYWKGKLGFDPFNTAQMALSGGAPHLKQAALGFFRAIRQRKGIVDHAHNKIEVAKRLCAELPGRKLVFGGDNAFSDMLNSSISGSVIYHSTMPKSEAQAALDQFKSGQAEILVSTKALNQGLDIPDASVGVICGLTSKSLTMVQRVGRLVRIDPSDPTKTGKVIVVYVKDSQEETWLKDSLQKLDRSNIQWTSDLDSILT